MAAEVYPLPKHVRPIGLPYQGTHAKKFNAQGGSDNWESENAVDLPTPKGTPVYAVSAGTIGSQIGSLNEGGRFAGLRLHLVTQGNEFYYAHLSKLVVKAGEKVHAGQLLGYTGVANGVAHLHIASKTGDPRQAFGIALPAATASTDTGQTTSGGGTAVPQPTVTPPVNPASYDSTAPTAVSTPTPDVELPGSQDYTLGYQPPHQLWQQAAQTMMVSPETQQMLANAQLATGG